MHCLYQAFIYAAHIFPSLLQLWDAFRVLGIKTTQELVVHTLLPLFQFWRCSLKEDILAQDWWARRMFGERAYVYRLKRYHSRLRWDCLYLSINQLWLARERATIRSFLLLAYMISQCRYQLMHLDLRGSLSPLIYLSATKTQSPPPSPGPSVLLPSSTMVIAHASPSYWLSF